jgi:hypothetical protein
MPEGDGEEDDYDRGGSKRVDFPGSKYVGAHEFFKCDASAKADENSCCGNSRCRAKHCDFSTRSCWILFPEAASNSFASMSGLRTHPIASANRFHREVSAALNSLKASRHDL